MGVLIKLPSRVDYTLNIGITEKLVLAHIVASPPSVHLCLDRAAEGKYPYSNKQNYDEQRDKTDHKGQQLERNTCLVPHRGIGPLLPE